MGLIDRIPTPSAYSQARLKLKPEVFPYLNTLVSDGFHELYGADEQVKLWKGRRVIGHDGTYLNLPDTPETRAQYSVQENQYAEAACVQALAGALYDVLNAVGLSIAMSKKGPEKQLLFDQIEHTREGDVVVLDRLYADTGVMTFLDGALRAFVIRCPRGGCAAVKAFWASEDLEREVEIAVGKDQRAWARERGLAESARVRLVKVELDSGEIEVLATNLLDAEEVTREDLKTLYGLRWGVETFFDRLKNIYEVERFSGERVHSIKQDVYGMLFLATFESVLSKEAEAELARDSEQRAHRYEQQVNRCVSYSALLGKAVHLLLDTERSAEQTLEDPRRLFKTNPTRCRPGRKVTRTKKSAPCRLRYYRYKKRVIA
jgi:hypothetical protein